jgi:DNA-binding CsgD family transcriptional regulator
MEQFMPKVQRQRISASMKRFYSKEKPLVSGVDKMILTHLSNGLIIKEIAAMLGVTKGVVNNNLKRMFKTFYVKNSLELVSYCLRNRYIE